MLQYYQQYDRWCFHQVTFSSQIREVPCSSQTPLIPCPSQGGVLYVDTSLWYPFGYHSYFHLLESAIHIVPPQCLTIHWGVSPLAILRYILYLLIVVYFIIF
jgi:hypothetical protein